MYVDKKKARVKNNYGEPNRWRYQFAPFGLWSMLIYT